MMTKDRGYTEDRGFSASDPQKTNPQSRVSETVDYLREAQAFAGYYVAAQLDRVKVVARNLAIFSALGILALIAGVAVIVMAVVLLCTGISGGFSRLYGGIPWLGDLTTALIILVTLAIIIKMGISRMMSASKRQLVDSYEKRKSRQRSEFGADVHEQSL